MSDSRLSESGTSAEEVETLRRILRELARRPQVELLEKLFACAFHKPTLQFVHRTVPGGDPRNGIDDLISFLGQWLDLEHEYAVLHTLARKVQEDIN